MKVAVSASAPSLDAPVDPRFGRCAYFLIVETDTMKFEAIPNPAQYAGGGAGIQAAQIVASKGVEAVLTGNVGPNAHQALSAAGIRIVTGVYGTVREAIMKFKRGEAENPPGPTVPMHYGMGISRRMGVGMRRGRGRYTQPIYSSRNAPSPDSANSAFHTHKECAHFNNGFCTLSGAIVDPEGPACPNFTPKIEAAAPQPAPPQIQQAWRPPAHLQPAFYPVQQSSSPLGYVPYPWAYGYMMHPPFFTGSWNPYEFFDYWMMPWLNFPWPYMGYEPPIYGYGRQPYPPYPLMPPSPFQAPPELLNEELAALEAYKRELQAEIEEINARIRELRRWIGR